MAVTISGSSGINQDNVGYAPVKSFTSSNITMPTAASQLVTTAHGLGAVPRIIRVVAVCTSAVNGWAIGDEVEPMFGAVDNGAYQTRPWANATNVYFTSGSAIMILNRTNYYTYNITNVGSNWVMKVYAFL